MKRVAQALKTSRVRESLGALFQQVEYAIQLTRLDPVKTSDPVLTGDSLPPEPDMTAVKPNAIASDNETRRRWAKDGLEILGSHLDTVGAVLIIQAGKVGPWVAAAKLRDEDHSETRILARISGLKEAPEGSFNLLLITTDGEPSLFPNAFFIDAATCLFEKSSEGSRPKTADGKGKQKTGL